MTAVLYPACLYSPDRSPLLALMVIREVGAHLPARTWLDASLCTTFSFPRPAVRPLRHHFIDSTHALFAASTPIAEIDLRCSRLRGAALGRSALPLPLPLVVPPVRHQRPGRA